MKYTENKYGFSYGPMKLIRASSDEKLGVWIFVGGERGHVQIRVTNSGLVRVGKPTKNEGNDKDFFKPEHT